jgi:hypothetical protein
MPIRPQYASLVLGAAGLLFACAQADDQPLVYGAGSGEMTGGSTSSGGSAGTGASGGATGGTDATGGVGGATGGTGGAAAGAGGATGGTGGATAGTGGATAGTGGATGGTGGATGGTGGTGKSTGGTGPTYQATIDLPYADDFEDGNDNDWFPDVTSPANTDAVGDWGIVDDGGNQIYQAKTAFEDESWTVGGDRNWTDVRIEARVRFDSETADGDGMIYLAGRWAPGDRDYYWVEFRSTGKPKVRRKLDGSSADIVTLDIDEIVAGMGTWHSLALVLKGAEATLELDGMVLGTGTDSAPLARGGIALGTRDCVASFDDVKVSVP